MRSLQRHQEWCGSCGDYPTQCACYYSCTYMWCGKFSGLMGWLNWGEHLPSHMLSWNLVIAMNPKQQTLSFGQAKLANLSLPSWASYCSSNSNYNGFVVDVAIPSLARERKQVSNLNPTFVQIKVECVDLQCPNKLFPTSCTPPMSCLAPLRLLFIGSLMHPILPISVIWAHLLMRNKASSTQEWRNSVSFFPKLVAICLLSILICPT